MAIFAGKSPAERNKIIAAAVLGVLALFALYMAFGPSIRGKASPVVSPSPSPSIAANQAARTGNDKFTMPTQGQVDFGYTTTPVVYNGPIASTTDVGRNIFAFFEPPPPTPWQPTPLPTVKPPSPTPTPPVQLAYVMPQTVFAGTGSFRLEVNGDKFTSDMRIYFNQSQVPTSFVTAQRMAAEIPAALIANEGPKTVIVQSLDGKLYSTQIILNVQAPPKPQFQYIGMIGRKRYNNDTAYFQENGKTVPMAARLNDIVGGRFRLMSISSAEAILEDVNLGFRYKLPLAQAPVGGSSGSPGGRPDFPDNVYQQYNQQGIPGIPNNIPRYVPPQQIPRQRPEKPQPDKKDVNDNDDTDN
jgi:hypothetical protein